MIQDTCVCGGGNNLTVHRTHDDPEVEADQLHRAEELTVGDQELVPVVGKVHTSV